MSRFEAAAELVQRDRVARWTAIVGVALVWLSVAWLDPLPLLVLLVAAAAAYLFRRRHPLELDDEVDVL